MSARSIGMGWWASRGPGTAALLGAIEKAYATWLTKPKQARTSVMFLGCREAGDGLQVFL